MFTPPDTADDGALHAHQIAVLARLADLGLNIAAAIEGQVTAGAAPDAAAAAASWAMAYGRVARAVRLSVMLQARLVDEARDRERQAASSAAFAKACQENARKARVGRIVERVVDEACDDADEAERACEEATERLDQDDLYGGVLDRPVSELVAMICQDLGVAPDWAVLAREAWALEEQASGAVGWPLAAAAPADRRPGRRKADALESFMPRAPPS